ncbi:hypothetical protein P154DRAFT_537809 [Amniculicola lignicola CBS 123094]|uniref:Uncharacterized protein n=1 Tax=Amniculicola lignicola CBS 123094 TaxID=1392246 RepID=A0A6A5W423_9PLEO|nr:hypothetical protein P154DRAFT_537809 [Amniculicola lignicola CBS 123094]
MAEELFCCYFEERVIAVLPKKYSRRPEARLTVTERERITAAFNHSSLLLRDSHISFDLVKAKIALVPRGELHRLDEVLMVLSIFISREELREIALLLGKDAEYDDEAFREHTIQLLAAIRDIKGGAGCPDYTPLGLWAMFDHWQEDMEQFDYPPLNQG